MILRYDPGFDPQQLTFYFNLLLSRPRGGLPGNKVTSTELFCFALAPLLCTSLEVTSLMSDRSSGIQRPLPLPLPFDKVHVPSQRSGLCVSGAG